MVDTGVVRHMADVIGTFYIELSREESRRYYIVMRACAEEIDKLRVRLKARNKRIRILDGR